MTRVQGDLKIITGTAEAVTEVWVRSKVARPVSGGWLMTTNDRKPVFNGKVDLELLPGACVLVAVSSGLPGETVELIVPESGTASLEACIRAAEAAGDLERDALDELRRDLGAWIDEVRASLATADSSAKAAKAEADRAKSSADSAGSSASGAKGSADAAKGSADAASKSATTAAGSASAAKADAGKAATSATEAGRSATAAKADADRAANIASSTSWSGDRLTVNGKTSPPLSGPQGIQGPPGGTGIPGASIIPSDDKGQLWPRDIGLKANANDSTVGGSYSTTAGQGNAFIKERFFTVSPKLKYRAGLWVKADKPNSVLFIELRNQDGVPAVKSGSIGRWNNAYLVANMLVPTEWTWYEADLELHPNTSRVKLDAFFFNHASGSERGAVVSLSDIHLTPLPAHTHAGSEITSPIPASAYPETGFINTGVNLDSMRTTGVFIQNKSADAQTSLNYPVGVAGLLEVSNGYGMTWQRYTLYGADAGKVFVRGCYNSTWYPWRQLPEAGHKHTLSEIGDAPNSHTAAPTPNTLVSRNGSGTAQFRDPVSGQDAATKNYVDTKGAETKAYVDSRVKQVTSPPSTFEPGVLYVIPE